MAVSRSQFPAWYHYWAATLCIFGVNQAALAQTVAPSQVTPEVAPKSRLPEQPVIEQLQNNASANFVIENDSHLTVAEVSVRYEDQRASDDVRDFVANLRGQRVTLQQIMAAANGLERRFHAQGYILRRVVFPPQTFEDGGTLKVEVIDGFIERIDSSALGSGLAAVVEPRLKRLLRKPGLRLADIERALMIANEIPGVNLRSALSQGVDTGGVLLTVESDFTRTSASVQADNYLPASLAHWQFGATVTQNNTLGMGDAIYVRAGSDGNFSAIRDRLPRFGYLGAGVSLPLDTDGSYLAFDAIVSRSSTAARAGAPAIDGRLTQTSLRLNILPVLNRKERLGVEVALETVRQSLEAADFGVQLTRDAYRIARLSVLSDRVIGASRLALNAQFSAGLGGRLDNGLDPSSAGLSRQGASPNFAKLSADGLVQVPLNVFRFDLAVRGQTSFGNPVLLSEQFSLDGLNAISTPVSGRFLVDSGQTSRIEALAPGVIKALPGLEPYFFAAQGYGARMLPTVVESRSVLAGAFGVGARVRLGRVQLGVELGNQVAREFDTSWSEHARLTLSIR